MQIGAERLRPRVLERGERLGCRMPVAIVRSDGDESETGPYGGGQRGILIARAVVGDLHHVRPEFFPTAQQRGLLLGSGVGEQQSGDPSAAHSQHEARGVRVGRHRPGVRREHLPPQGAVSSRES
ncbi:hypothetical protein [Leucobacter ruminantium]|uniref:hypothetical protein n=1 Tax=Leucobacter ruminantium TaxID=1289170 RepID=UPI001FB85EFD|nr:hypothetical protein [Leucobacter ruminantium]